jgi:hypothetical protein
MKKVVVDTNVLLVANGQHDQASTDCVVACVMRLQGLTKTGGVVIDDGHRILGEYRKKTALNPPKGVGDVFLKWLMRNATNNRHVDQVPLTETAPDSFDEFPVPSLAAAFDPPDRKFVAVAHAHPRRPPVWQAADSKWLDWWQELLAQGVRVEFLCRSDLDRFYRKKFPDRPDPPWPQA